MEEPRLDFEAIFADLCCGNVEARKFCTALLNWIHLIDDVVDRDKAVGHEALIRASLEAALMFGFNPFWQANKAALLPLLMTGVRAWADSEIWRQKENFRDRASAEVLKSQYQDTFLYVAKICGGWDHYTKMTGKWRFYHYELRDEPRTLNLEPRTLNLERGKENGKPHLVDQLVEMLRGNDAGVQFCLVFIQWCHWIDDAVDRDRAWGTEAVARVNLEALVVFSDNVFFQRHKDRLAPLVVQGCRAFGDSVAWEKRADVKDRRAADVLKSYYHEVVWHAAYLAAADKGEDAWAHLSAMMVKFRSFNYDQ